MNLDEIAIEIHQTSVEKGFYDGELTTDKIMAKLALLHSEVTETLEAIRKDKGEVAIVDELADILIRTLDLWGALWVTEYLNVSLDEALIQKMIINKKRPHLHGHKWG